MQYRILHDSESRDGKMENLLMAEKIQPGRSIEESRCRFTAIRKAPRRISQFYDAALAPSGL
jgi:hypothetical protein